ncbi:uncharacterized protein LOC123301232 [Chrysoperla carnea]|uniref:uncharacterized protein LOC123301232 n=1 Tax=Chrysoperla carnea TaxID=189513 RepID=UPI001D086CF8|nr:uncharacterized protein LOC123301232 [Chrysoperla carnea]
MADDESSYEYACQRAELLGIDKPDKENFLKELAEKKALIEKQEDLEIKQLIVRIFFKELESQNENLKNVSGGLDELNSILTITQKKINRFKTACGSLTNLLKIKVGGESTDNSPSHHAQNNGSAVIDNEDNELNEDENGTQSEQQEEEDNTDPLTQMHKNVGKNVDSSLDKLDSLITKAERAQYSMQHQNKQMRSFISK